MYKTIKISRSILYVLMQNICFVPAYITLFHADRGALVNSDLAHTGDLTGTQASNVWLQIKLFAQFKIGYVYNTYRACYMLNLRTHSTVLRYICLLL
jgi:hypothetical protein